MSYYVVKMEYELYHHGVKGMKWGVRRFRKKDGSLTSAGKKRYQIKGATAAAYAPSLAADYAINQMKINRYVSKHPNTKLSDAEILKRIG